VGGKSPPVGHLHVIILGIEFKARIRAPELPNPAPVGWFGLGEGHGWLVVFAHPVIDGLGVGSGMGGCVKG
jgi:hypothetical protein